MGMRYAKVPRKYPPRHGQAAMVAKLPCNLTPRHPPSQVLDNLPRYAG
jgi:hypothetical protein